MPTTYAEVYAQLLQHYVMQGHSDAARAALVAAVEPVLGDENATADAIWTWADAWMFTYAVEDLTADPIFS